jgi:hypothetical protein
MPDEISGMGKTHGNASLICKKWLVCLLNTRLIIAIYSDASQQLINHIAILYK